MYSFAVGLRVGGHALLLEKIFRGFCTLGQVRVEVAVLGQLLAGQVALARKPAADHGPRGAVEETACRELIEVGLPISDSSADFQGTRENTKVDPAPDGAGRDLELVGNLLDSEHNFSLLVWWCPVL